MKKTWFLCAIVLGVLGCGSGSGSSGGPLNPNVYPESRDLLAEYQRRENIAISNHTAFLKEKARALVEKALSQMGSSLAEASPIEVSTGLREDDQVLFALGKAVFRTQTNKLCAVQVRVYGRVHSKTGDEYAEINCLNAKGEADSF